MCNTIPPLFLKTYNENQPLHEVHCKEPAGYIQLRNLSLWKDIAILHEWVNQPYSKKFWQSAKPLNELVDLYKALLYEPGRHAIIGLWNNKPVCHVELYRIVADSSLFQCIPEAKADDCGIHFLMAPPREIFKGLSLLMLRSFIAFYFANPFSGDLYVEPDELNALANLLAKKAGFQLYRKVNLPDKIANVYKITKQEFLSGSR